MAILFFTGFPGFLGSALLPRVLARAPDARAVCLVQPRFAALARERVTALAGTPAAGRVEVVEGDITRPGLGLTALQRQALHRSTREVYHLAAVYDLAVPRDLAMRVNVDGTRHVLELAHDCPGLARFHHVSTCYVSGRHRGVFLEDDLEKGQAFNNFYEETKYLSEAEVHGARRVGMPVTVYRPAVVVGDSVTGETQKYDGPYYVIRWLLRQPRLAVMPVVGDPRATVFNVVPRDFVVNALAYLSGRCDTAGHTYALADPDPPTVDEMLRTLGRATGRRMLRVPLSLKLAKGAIEHVPGVDRLLRIPAPAVDYFVHPTRYGTGHAQAALAGSGIQVPRFAAYADRLVDFVRAHPEIGAGAMA
ncbi:MAG TPA: SDR family oxidoreductase [Longimicrobium sp.]